MYEKNEGKISRRIPLMPNYLDIQLLKETPNCDNHECYCYICRIGRQKGHTKTVAGRGLKKESTFITAANCCLEPRKRWMSEPWMSIRWNDASNVNLQRVKNAKKFLLKFRKANRTYAIKI